MSKWVKRSILGAAVLVAIQAVRPARTNPPIDPTRAIGAKLSLDPAVAGIFSRSCDDCHSNRTVWPWYSNVAPVSWLVIRDVDDGRRHMNFSDWAALPPKRVEHRLDDICKDVKSADMPMKIYTPMHPLSKLAPADITAICHWTAAQLTLPPSARITEPRGSNERP